MTTPQITAPMYRFESNLVDEFLSATRSTAAWGQMRTSTEFDYQRGRTDIIAIDRDGALIAFEAKLEKWRGALQQAYRNTCFAHRSYVLLPEKTALIASKYLAEFERRKVGLCYLSNGKLVVVYEPPLVAPIQPWLSKVAIDAILSRPENALH
jgi:hypothetical protein